MFHTFQSTEPRPFRKRQKQKRRNRNRKNINFTLKTFVGVNKNIKIKYGTTLNELDNIIKKAYNVKNGVKLIVQGIQINKQVDKEQTIGDLIKANTQKQYTIYVVFTTEEDSAAAASLRARTHAHKSLLLISPSFSIDGRKNASTQSADSAEESADSAEEEDSAAEEQYSSEEEDETDASEEEEQYSSEEEHYLSTDASEEEEQYSSEEEQESEEPPPRRGTRLHMI